MRSLELPLHQYNSDKIANRYLDTYDKILTPFTDKKIFLLELGIYKGGSLLLWRDYFPMGTIVGIDINIPKNFKRTERIQIFEGSQTDCNFLSSVSNSTAPNGFDIIIDDASHMGEMTKTSFWHLFENHLKPGGLYVIEDWGTGYWSDWPDGKNLNLEKYKQPKYKQHHYWSFLLKVMKKLNLITPLRSMSCHNYGMVGFIKQLIDEQAAHDVTRGNLKGKPKRNSKFDNMMITPSIVFIKKAGNKI